MHCGYSLCEAAFYLGFCLFLDVDLWIFIYFFFYFFFTDFSCDLVCCLLLHLRDSFLAFGGLFVVQRSKRESIVSRLEALILLNSPFMRGCSRNWSC